MDIGATSGLLLLVTPGNLGLDAMAPQVSIPPRAIGPRLLVPIGPLEVTLLHVALGRLAVKSGATV